MCLERKTKFPSSYEHTTGLDGYARSQFNTDLESSLRDWLPVIRLMYGSNRFNERRADLGIRMVSGIVCCTLCALGSVDVDVYVYQDSLHRVESKGKFNHPKYSISLSLSSRLPPSPITPLLLISPIPTPPTSTPLSRRLIPWRSARAILIIIRPRSSQKRLQTMISHHLRVPFHTHPPPPPRLTGQGTYKPAHTQPSNQHGHQHEEENYV